MQASLRMLIITTVFLCIALLCFRIELDKRRFEIITDAQTEEIKLLEEKVEQYRREQDALIYYYTTEQWK